MEVSSVSSQSSWYSAKKKSMTDSEKEKAQEILSQYDADNISEDEQKSMMEQFKKSGLQPTDELKKMISDAGFEITAPPQLPTNDINPLSILTESSDADSSDSDLSSLLEKYNNGEISEEKLRTKLEEVTAQVLYGFSTTSPGNLINIEA